MQHHSRSLWVIFGILLIDTMGFGIVIPILPKLVQHMLGGAVAQASTVYGLLLASFSLMSFLFSPVMGALADRFEPLRPVGIGPGKHDADQGRGEYIRRTLE